MEMQTEGDFKKYSRRIMAALGKINKRQQELIMRKKKLYKYIFMNI